MREGKHGYMRSSTENLWILQEIEKPSVNITESENYMDFRHLPILDLILDTTNMKWQ